MLDLARDLVKAERTVEPATSEERGKAALTELFEQARNDRTPIMVERIVNDIDEIVRHVRFEGWQTTHAGEREVKKALRKTLFKYRLHQDKELFDRAYRLHPAVLLTLARNTVGQECAERPQTDGPCYSWSAFPVRAPAAGRGSMIRRMVTGREDLVTKLDLERDVNRMQSEIGRVDNDLKAAIADLKAT